MELVRSPLDAALSEGHGKRHTFFAASLFQKRPPCEEIQNYQKVVADRRARFEKSMARKSCPVSWLSIFIDEEGALVLAAAKCPQQMVDMKSHLRTVLKGQIPEQQLQMVENTLHPLDELDKDRLAAFKTVESLRPEESGDEDEDEESDEAPAKCIGRLGTKMVGKIGREARIAPMSDADRLKEIQYTETELEELKKQEPKKTMSQKDLCGNVAWRSYSQGKKTLGGPLGRAACYGRTMCLS